MKKESKKATIGLKLAIVVLRMVRKMYYWALVRIIKETDDVNMRSAEFYYDIEIIKSIYRDHYRDKLSDEFPMVIKRHHKGKVRYDMLLVQPPDHNTIVVRFERHTPSGQEYTIVYKDK